MRVDRVRRGVLFGLALAAVSAAAAFRPPAVPLVTSDPYLSIWSESDRLTDDVTRHWTGRPHPLAGLVRVDGRAFRILGPEPASIPALPQTSLSVLPTRSVYTFAGRGVRVTLTFMAPALPDDLDALTLPLSYVSARIQSLDRQLHSVALLLGAGAELAVNTPSQAVEWRRETAGPLTLLRAGSADQTYFDPQGDDVRIDWGYAYLAAAGSRSAIAGRASLLSDFAGRGRLPDRLDSHGPRPVRDDPPMLAVAFDLGSVGVRPVERHAIVAYDEVYAIDYFGQRLRPYWRRNGESAAAMLRRAERSYPDLTRRCAAFDARMLADLRRVGGESYARIGSLAYRQCWAGMGIAADAHGQPLVFTKENTSNGDIATVDVIYPMEPMLLLFNPLLAKAALVSNLDYASSARWRFPFAPHDLGTYPAAFGRDDGGEIMEVEESGNMLLLLAAIAQIDGDARFAARWWPKVTQWAAYIRSRGFDLPDQLTTDDFAGRSAHNANLAVKAILALDAYGRLCDLRGNRRTGAEYHRLSRDWARRWAAAAREGDHYRLTYDRPGTWSQKYNLVWDRVLSLGVFPQQVARRETAYYLTRLQRYGLPLDSRKLYTKTDWTLWTAAVAPDDRDFRRLIDPVVRFLDVSPSRVPFSDFYWTQDARDAGMHARPVIGGVFVKLLADPAVWRRWARAAPRRPARDWAPLPRPRPVREVVASGLRQPVEWRYTTEPPPSAWITPEFNDSSWQRGASPFGTPGTPGIAVRTRWDTPDIWLRRSLIMPAVPPGRLVFNVYHDEDVEIFVNGVLAARAAGYDVTYRLLPIRSRARAQLRPGSRITLAVHCHQTTGGQGIDVGIAVQPSK